MHNNKSILISGATGFIGNSIVSKLSTRYNFVNIGRNESLICKNVNWDLRSKLFINTKPDCKIAIHCASIVGSNSEICISDYIDVNVKSTAELIEYCIKNNYEKFILISTGGVYGFNDSPMTENELCNPQEIYSLSKYFSERICKLYCDKINIIVLRLFYPYGNCRNNRLISKLTYNVITGKDIILNEKGLPIINPIHVVDFVNIVEILLNSSLEGVFNVCGNEEISIENLCKLIAKKAKVNNINFIYNNNISKNMIGSNVKLYDFIGYNQKISLCEGIEQLVYFLKTSKEGL